jgi:prepilin-type N-terminal cleavage/methylation domain-containing protein
MPFAHAAQLELAPPPNRPRLNEGGLAAPKLPSEGGFSLLEIMVVLALFGLIAALLIGGGGSLLQASSRDNAENTALTAIAAARHQAVLAGQIVELHIDEKARALDWGAGQAPLPANEELNLLPPDRSGAMLIGGQLKEESIARVRFYADGTCDPFRLEITRDASRRVIAIDPWTCAALAPDKKPGAF